MWGGVGGDTGNSEKGEISAIDTQGNKLNNNIADAFHIVPTIKKKAQ